MDYNNTGAMRSPFSPRVRQSITGRRPIGLSSQKNQSKFNQSSNDQPGEVIYKTPQMTVETYGLPLPVMVTEVLTLGSGDVSVRMSECGWCWVVTGRRILAWPHTLNPDDGNSPLPAGGLAARELTLPQTDLAHKADLVMVFYSEGAQMASCVGVSPEGVVRYWPSVGQEGVHSDVSCELGGQECDRLVMASGALVLATTTCTLVIIEPATVDGRQTVTWRRLCPPSGWLGGIGRRVSHMFFGSMPANTENKLVGVVGIGGSKAAPHLALVARHCVLQLWRGTELHEHATLLDQHLHGEGVTSRDVVALDVQAMGEDELLLLLAITAPRHPDKRYAVAHINISSGSSPTVRVAGAARGWEAGGEPRLLPLGTRAMLYTHQYIAISSMSNEPVECICINKESERILCCALFRSRALLFSKKHGCMRLTHTRAHNVHTRSACDSPLGSPCTSDMYDGNLSLFEIDPHEISTVTTDACGKLKTAFLFHLRRESSACRQLLGELFPQLDSDTDSDGALASTVRAVACEMLDDVPAGDPRWKARPGLATSIPLGSSAALQISAQLADKRRAFALYADFLRSTGLLQRAGNITLEGGRVCSSAAALCSCAELLSAACALRLAQDAGGALASLIARPIHMVIGDGSEEEDSVRTALAQGALSPDDVCYRRVSQIARVLVALARSSPPPHAAHHLNTLLTSVLSEMHKSRVAWGCEPPPPELGARALLPALVDAVKYSVTESAPACPTPTLRAQVIESAVGLARSVLHEAAPLHHIKQTEEYYNTVRRQVIMTFADAEGGSGAAHALALADSFRDYEALVQLCVQTDDIDALQQYILKYQHEGMAETAYSWLVSRGGAHAARVARGGAGTTRLLPWLLAHSSRAPLAALHALHSRQARLSARLRADIAQREPRLEAAATAASLGKLCLLAGADDEGPAGEAGELRARLERVLALADQQRALPADSRRQRGLHEGSEPVLDAEQMVQMYVESESPSLTEYDYKKALDLTDYVHDMERRDDLRLRVWCACIRRDVWGAGDAEREQLTDKMLFRLIDLVHVMGGDLELLLPPLEDILTAPELADLASSPAFHYRLKYGYQCLHTTTLQDN